MRLIFIGPPGSGKGTQAQLLKDRLGLVQFATGDILRDAVARNTAEGVKAKVYMNAGQLVPDDIVNDIVNARFRGKDRPLKFIMDGYPRTLAQAVSFDSVLKEQGSALDAVVFLNVDDDEIVRRNSARWTCMNAQCKATYNTISRPPRTPDLCDKCQQPLAQRDDDRPETIRKRLQVFHEQQQGILQHYARLGLLKEVRGQGDIDAIHAQIVRALNI